ncbi:hypothetical protein apy_08530 [Aeropyrum pernix]|uniref:Protoporphyrinogen IX oxidase n=1 Tax=Aeropyrum pernix TaxID=56636 RepID=A0A401H9T7_AERPX|nr:hypothetical protein [Aeropyrum pernix]GBF09128.1 hypothetical protein apy_08530 [Aeropyrum pernix]
MALDYMLLQLIHVFAAILWAGAILNSLWLLARGRDSDLRLVLRFTGWPATLGVVVAGASGLVMAHLRGYPPLAHAKIGLYALLFIIGGYAHYRLAKSRGEGLDTVDRLLLLTAAVLTAALVVVGSLLRFGL